ncbi:MAG TPA: DUF4202 family protein [Polyangiaceae bacterium]|nr:DUF4202 family protein [Polyangiaceae bacterium]
MLDRLLLASTGPRLPDGLAGAVRRRLERASSFFAQVAVQTSGDGAADATGPSRQIEQNVVVPVRRWLDPRSDPAEIDQLVEAAAAGGRFSITLAVAGNDAAGNSGDAEICLAALQVVTRCQRFLPFCNSQSCCSLFERVLLSHRAAHDLSKPLVRADFAHSLDTHRWLLRLEPRASLALQLAALLHDVERLVTESDRHVEHHATDFVAFKRAHTASGPALARRLLHQAAAPAAVAARVTELVFAHERPRADTELTLLNEADALSFFSLNASGFVNHYPALHTQKKVQYTLERLGARGRAQLSSIRHAPLVQAVLLRYAVPDHPPVSAMPAQSV